MAGTETVSRRRFFSRTPVATKLLNSPPESNVNLSVKQRYVFGPVSNQEHLQPSGSICASSSMVRSIGQRREGALSLKKIHSHAMPWVSCRSKHTFSHLQYASVRPPLCSLLPSRARTDHFLLNMLRDLLLSLFSLLLLDSKLMRFLLSLILMLLASRRALVKSTF